jgi:CzcA family heavy metal efflux pump
MNALLLWAAYHRRSILFLLALGVLGGAISAFYLPVALFPDVSFPRVSINFDSGAQPAETMVAQVTRSVEQAVRLVPAVRDVRSTTSRGSADVSVNFDWGRDMDLATLQVESAISRILPTLPAGTVYKVRRMNPTVFPIAAYSLTSGTLDQRQLRNIAQYQLTPLLLGVTGVASVDVLGGDVSEYRVEVEPALLAAHGITLDDVTKAVTAGNVLHVAGYLEDRHKLLLATSDTRLLTVSDIQRIVVQASKNGPVALSEVANVYLAAEPNYTAVTADGQRAVLFQVYQQPSGNTVQIVAAVQSTLKDFTTRLPPGVTVHNWYDQSQLIVSSAASVAEAIVIGIFLAGIVLYVFLRNRKITMVVLIVVPTVLGITVLILSLLGMSFNIMTLGGMAAAIGLVIDDAIVMIEHIVRRLKGTTDTHLRIRFAAVEFLSPLAGSSLATIVIFVPLAFLGGVTGAFFRALSVTMASALIVSFAIAWFIVPLLADSFISAKDADNEAGEKLVGRMVSVYRAAETRIRRRPWLAGIACLVLLAAGGLAYTQVGSGFMPAMDEGGFVLDYIAPPGTSLQDTNALLRQVEDILQKTPEVDTYSRRTGLQLGGGVTEANTGDFFVRLKPQPRRDIDDVTADVHQQISDKVPGLQIEIAQLMEDLIGDLTAVPQPIEIKMFSDDAGGLRTNAPKVAELISHIDGVTEINNGVIPAGDGLDVKIDRSRAALEGVDPSAIADQMETIVAGTVATNIQNGDQTIGVRVWIPAEERTNIANLKGIQIVAPDGHKFALGRVADFQMQTGQPEITRDNIKNMVAVTARIEGRDLGSTVAEVKKTLDASGLFTGSTYYELGGLYAEQQAAFKGLAVVIVAAFLLVFVLLMFLYERFAIALAIVAMPMLAMPAVFVALWLTGIELNISAMMGMTMVVGIVTEVAIFFFSEYEYLVNTGVAQAEALLEAGANRFRPIAMTTLAAILTLLPLAFALGQGAAMQQPLAVAIIGGLLVQMPLVLLVMPMLFSLLDRTFSRHTTPPEGGHDEKSATRV